MITRRDFVAQLLLACTGLASSSLAPYSLIVIDCQEGYTVPRQPALSHIVREIHTAIKAKATIILLMTSDAGPLNATILRECEGYADTHIVGKVAMDGSDEVMCKLFTHNLNRYTLKVCGCNTDMCVYQTVAGLSHKIPGCKIEIAANACDSSYRHEEGLTMLSKVKGVKVQ